MFFKDKQKGRGRLRRSSIYHYLMFTCCREKKYAIDPNIVAVLTSFKVHLLSVSGTLVIPGDSEADLTTKWRKAT